MYILGLSTMGDAAACLIKDGEVVAAAEEERFSRIKHHIGFPHGAVRYVLEEADIRLSDVAHVALYWKPWILWRRAVVGLSSLFGSWSAFDARVRRGAAQVRGDYASMFSMARHLRKSFGESNFEFHYVEHHVCHAASAFLVSPFEQAAILTVDGAGEDTTTMFAVGEGPRIKVLRRIRLPHSLGQFYSAITNFLGFDMLAGDEWKVMGLAAWGEPEFYEYLRKRILVSNGAGGFHLNWRLLDHHLAKEYVFSRELREVIGENRREGEEITKRHRNIAASAQRVLEDVVLQMLRWLHERTKARALCMAGGVVFNSVMNGRVLRESPFEKFFFQPAAGDAGCAMGGCYQVWHGTLGKPRRYVLEHAYWGPGFSGDACRQALERSGLPHKELGEDGLVREVAGLLAEGNIIAWYQGRMEWGPRALGNRSFLADPRDPKMREKLNRDVKLREWFRPLAPSVLEEDSAVLFGETYRDPFMMTVAPLSSGIRERIPAVAHVDGTARPQTVSGRSNPRYWRLLREFKHLTGVPCLLNTSFNIQEPIVCSPDEAIDTFLRSKLKYLVLDRYLVTRDDTGQ